MDRWKNKIAVVTGAGSGIGAACAIDFIKAGMIVIGIGRRLGRIEVIKSKIPEELRCNFYPKKCDVKVERSVKDTFEWIVSTFNGIDVLVNCAGIFKAGVLTDMYNTPAYKNALDTAFLGSMYCTRESFESMKSRNVAGHIFFVSSTLIQKNGSLISWNEMDINICAAQIHGIKALVQSYRHEFRDQESLVRVTDVRIGAVATDFWNTDFGTFIFEFPFLEPKEVSDAIVFVLGTPQNVEVTNLTIKPLGEKF